MSEGTDAIPVGFAFTSQRGEHRNLQGAMPEFLAWEDFRDAEWLEVLSVARGEPYLAVRPPAQTTRATAPAPLSWAPRPGA
jgi:hypothetical protein